ncbi:MAG: bifunctional 3,4-dihydroxy-2-butanone-4-phosphate synthase/GTP cyclohydrolase II, partial [Acaryochloridaceae cyanobacterium SU_2_1]|nr:bifunctional 3,4-dihydroxy-2-butanone-4-phosphate synthase/GTP cyclohydrolase II [Acaryochloridaceae cyanobacterium SU_2_1]
GAQILNDLGIENIRLITNNPRKIAGLKGYGLEVVDRVPLLIEATPYNTTYLNTKAEKLGHMLLQTYLLTVALRWQDESLDVKERYHHLEKLRFLAETQHLLLKEEARPVAIALFGKSSLIFHLGLDQADVAAPDWYQQADHPYLGAIAQILEHLKQWPQVASFEFLISPGSDPLKSLQIKLDRQTIVIGSTAPTNLS